MIFLITLIFETLKYRQLLSAPLLILESKSPFVVSGQNNTFVSMCNLKIKTIKLGRPSKEPPAVGAFDELNTIDAKARELHLKTLIPKVHWEDLVLKFSLFVLACIKILLSRLLQDAMTAYPKRLLKKFCFKKSNNWMLKIVKAIHISLSPFSNSNISSCIYYK